MSNIFQKQNIRKNKSLKSNFNNLFTQVLKKILNEYLKLTIICDA